MHHDDTRAEKTSLLTRARLIFQLVNICLLCDYVNIMNLHYVQILEILFPSAVTGKITTELFYNVSPCPAGVTVHIRSSLSNTVAYAEEVSFDTTYGQKQIRNVGGSVCSCVKCTFNIFLSPMIST